MKRCPKKLKELAAMPTPRRDYAVYLEKSKKLADMPAPRIDYAMHLGYSTLWINAVIEKKRDCQELEKVLGIWKRKI